MLVVAHLSDPHLGGSPDRPERLRRTLAHATGGARRADVVLLTGDIADSGRPEQYAQASRLLAEVSVPVLAVPGNHDDRVAFRAGLLAGPGDGDVPCDGPLHRVRSVAGASFVLLDSTVPGADGGHLGTDSLTWLAGALRQAIRRDGAPVFVVMHHPPIALGHPSLDAIGLADAAAFADVVAGHPGVTAVLAGHAHSSSTGQLGGVPVILAPGIASTFAMPWEPAPTDVATAAAPGLAFHVVADNGSLTSHIRWVG